MAEAGKMPSAGLVLAVFAIALLSSCGGSDSSDTASSTSTGSTPERWAPKGEREPSAARGEDEKKVPSGGKASQKQSSGGKDVDPEPLRISGGGAEQFRTPGGDNSIQGFGEEGEESELEEAAEALHSFLVARAQSEWALACSHLAATVVRQFEQLATRSENEKAEDGDCASMLESLTAPLSAAAWRETTVVDARSLRREGEDAFLIYYGVDKTVFAIPMKEEDGAWKVGLISPTPIG